MQHNQASAVCFIAPVARPGTPQAAVRVHINRLAGALAVLAVMLALKQFYSAAGADRLTWILAPTARLTHWLTGAALLRESGVGYVDFSRGIIIAPACAGINFMIMAFGLAALCGLRHLRRMPPILAWLGLALAGAFGLAVGVNALRIAASMWLYQADIYTGWLTPARVHRLAGVSLYLCALGLFFKGLQPIIARYSRRFDPLEKGTGRPWPAWLPLGWYLLGAVGVPAADLVFRRPAAGFGEHCLTVVVAALVVWGGAGGIRRLAATTGHRRPTASRDREQEICRPKY